MENVIHKIGPVELLEADAARLYAEGKYIVTFSKIYQIMPPNKAHATYYGHVIYTLHGGGLTRRGRFHAITGSDVNGTVGYQLVNESLQKEV